MLKNCYTVNDLIELKEKIYKRFIKHGRMQNKITIAFRNYYNIIENKINNIMNKDNLICDICNNIYISKDYIIKNFDDHLNVCNNCIENYYFYCYMCGKPVYNEDIDNINFINDELYCNNCFFKVKEDIISNRIIKDKKLIKLDKYLKENNVSINYLNLKDLDFYIDNYPFNIEIYADSCYRLGSFNANIWIDLCKKEANLLKAIDFILEYYKAKTSIQEINGYINNKKINI